MIFSPIVLVLLAIGFFLFSSIIHVFLRVLRGRGGLMDTYRVVAYSSAALLFWLIPVIGSVLAVVYFAVLLFFGLREVHRVSAGRVLLGLSLPFVIAGLAAASFWYAFSTEQGLSAGLEVSNVKFCVEVNDEGRCNEKPDNLFHPGESVFVYSEVRGLTQRETDGQRSVWMIQRMKMSDAQGRVVFERAIDEQLPARSFNMYWSATPVNLTGFSPGEYTLEVVFRDGYNPLKRGVYKKTLYVK